MKVKETNIMGCKVISPKILCDNRGYFLEHWNRKSYIEIGINNNFVQDNIFTSLQGVLRGVHTQLRFPQAKIVSCLKGAIYDVAVDCRPSSLTLGKWHGEILTEGNHKQIFIPEGVAHGFYTIEDAMVLMKVSTHYTPGDEIGFTWNDSTINIDWPIQSDIEVLLAAKDKNWGTFSEMLEIIKKYR